MRGSLRLRLALLIGAVAVLPSVAGGLLFYRGARARVRDEVLTRMDAIADRTSNTIHRLLAERLGDGEVLAGLPSVRERSARLVAGTPAPGETLASLRDSIAAQIADVMTAYGRYTDGVVVNLATGRPIAWCVSPGTAPEQVGAGTDLLATAGGRGVGMSVAHLHPVTREPVADVVALIHAPGPAATPSPAIAALLLHVDLNRTVFQYLDDRSGMGQTGDVVLVDQWARPLRPLRGLSGGPLEAPLRQGLVLRAVAGESGITDGADYRGVHILGAYRHLEAEGWGLVVKMDAGEAYAGISRLGWIAAGILVALAGVGSGLAWVMAARTAQPVLELAAAARRVADGDLAVRVPSERPDELGAMARDFNAMVEQVQRETHERREAERALRETRDFLQNLLDYANAPVIVWDPELRITLFNHAFERLTGRSASEVVGRPLDLLFPEDRREEALAHIRRATAGELWETVEIPIAHVSGEVRTVLWNSATLRAADGETMVATIAQGQDITDRVAAERSLRETRDFLRNLLDYANAPVIVWDPGFRITLFNHAFERLTGRSASEVLGRPIDLLFPEDRREEALAHIRRATEGEFWETVEIPIAQVGGEVRTVLWNSATLRAPDGETAVATIAQGQDITERTLAEADRERAVASLRRAVGQLASANAELALLVSVASHDLREPLRAVMASVQLLQRGYAAALGPDGERLLSRAAGGATRLAQLMEAILSYARAGTAQLDRAPVDCGAVVDRVLADLEPLLEESQAQVTRGALPVVTGDEAQLARVFQNLLSNALKFRGEEPPRVRVTAERPEGEWTFLVEDNGIGIPAEDTERVFRVFERLHAEQEYQGTGIGLAICRRIVERHGGRLWVDSRLGEGSAFRFTLPDRWERTIPE